jgi:hypothetical protein
MCKCESKTDWSSVIEDNCCGFAAANVGNGRIQRLFSTAGDENVIHAFLNKALCRGQAYPARGF